MSTEPLTLVEEFDGEVAAGRISMTGSLAWRVLNELKEAERLRAQVQRLEYQLEAHRQAEKCLAVVQERV